MRTFIVNYSSPKEWKGTYQVRVEDSSTASINASDKVRKYLEDKYGKVKDSNCTVLEVYDNKIQKVGESKADLVKMFYKQFGKKEVALKRPLILEDDRDGFMSSGACARLTKLRAKSATQIEYYYDFWGAGWRNDNEYSGKVTTALKQVLGLTK